MPVKWTPDNDQILLLKILETHPSMSVDTSLVSAAWPQDREKPSPRAITERLVKIRKSAGAHFSVGSAQSANGGSAKVTPRKPRTPAAKKSIPAPDETPTTGQKRQRAEPPPKSTPTKMESGEEDDDDDDDEDFPDVKTLTSTPSPSQARRAAAVKAVQLIESSEDDEKEYSQRSMYSQNGNGSGLATPTKRLKVSGNTPSSAGRTPGSVSTSQISANVYPTNGVNLFPIAYEGDANNGSFGHDENGLDPDGDYEELDLSGTVANGMEDFGYSYDIHGGEVAI
ncbi:MAG: hypothetical protein M4579_000082 [Chaenotheca gracillima]|nr:MAG: hypothetical protein M4579_000082 [Chaenotheca gracillima]